MDDIVNNISALAKNNQVDSNHKIQQKRVNQSFIMPMDINERYNTESSNSTSTKVHNLKSSNRSGMNNFDTAKSNQVDISKDLDDFQSSISKLFSKKNTSILNNSSYQSPIKSGTKKL